MVYFRICIDATNAAHSSWNKRKVRTFTRLEDILVLKAMNGVTGDKVIRTETYNWDKGDKAIRTESYDGVRR